MDLAAAQLAATVALNLALAVLVGASLSAVWLRSGASTWALRHLAGLRRAVLAATGAAVLAYASLLWLDVAAMAEVPLSEAAPAILSALSATHYGFAWTIGVCSLTLIAVATALQAPRQPAGAAAWVRLLAIASFLYSRSIVSHAGAGGDFSIAVAVDWLHLLLISAWLGEVLVAGLATLRTPAQSIDEMRDRASYVQALSHTATLALAGIVATGLLSAWRGLGSLDNATGNPYATTLLVKLALVGSAAMLGGANRFAIMPDLLVHLRTGVPGAGRPERLFASVLQLEALALVAALVVAAVLGATSPPTA